MFCIIRFILICFFITISNYWKLWAPNILIKCEVCRFLIKKFGLAILRGILYHFLMGTPSFIILYLANFHCLLCCTMADISLICTQNNSMESVELEVSRFPWIEILQNKTIYLSVSLTFSNSFKFYQVRASLRATYYFAGQRKSTLSLGRNSYSFLSKLLVSTLQFFFFFIA